MHMIEKHPSDLLNQGFHDLHMYLNVYCYL